MLPSPVVDHIIGMAIKDRSPAYLCSDKRGQLIGWGGELEVYGIQGLKLKEPINIQLPFLEGLLPLEETSCLLPCLKFNEKVSADVHIFPDSNCDWILLLNVTSLEMEQILRQQKINDLNLLRQNQVKQLNQLSHLRNEAITPSVVEIAVMCLKLNGLTLIESPISAFSKFNLYIRSITSTVADEAGIVDNIIGNLIIAIFGIVPSTSTPIKNAVRAAIRIFETIQESSLRENLTEPAIVIVSDKNLLGSFRFKNQNYLSIIGGSIERAVEIQQRAVSSQILVDKETFEKLEPSLQKHPQIFKNS